MREPEVRNNSRKVTDAQAGIHKNLETVVKKHCQNTFQRPIAKHTQIAFDRVKPLIAEAIADGCPLIFDSCCGTAMSTRLIALDNRDALVIGIDRSAVRIGKEYNKNLPENALLVQAECADFWLLANTEGWKLTKHTIFYPNPYPKSKHLKRRWHGHPVFPVLLSLGGEIELRTNWKVYADEFCEAFNIVIDKKGSCEGVNTFRAVSPLTLFEKKYQGAGQPLYQCKIRL